MLGAFKTCATTSLAAVLLPALASAAVVITPGPANTVQDNPDPTDAFTGATVTSNRHTVGGTTAAGLFGSGTTLFDNIAYWDVSGNGNVPGPANGLNDNPNFVNFNTAAPVEIGGVRVQTSNRNDFHYEMIRFRLFASTDAGVTYTVPLSDVVVMPGPYDAAWDQPRYNNVYNTPGQTINDLVIEDTFAAPVTYQYFRAEFHMPNRDPSSLLVHDLEALAPVPEPTSLAVFGLAAGGLLLSRRRLSYN